MHRGTAFVAALAVLCAFAALGRAAEDNNYNVTVLVANQPGVAPVTDPKLVNAWGIAATGTSPWWVANNGTNSSTLYNASGVKQSLEVNVQGGPTGMVAAPPGAHFLLSTNPDRPARFMWASEDGTISGWNPQFNATQAKVLFSSSGSIYKGLTVIGDMLFTTDFAECEVEAISGLTLQEVPTTGGFEDESIPEGYCPFGIQAIAGSIFVTYAKRGGVDDIAGVSHGFVREFDTNGNLLAEVASHGTLNSPWGLAMAPEDFGKFSNCLLVGNFGDGLINAYCEDHRGEFRPRGRLQHNDENIQIDGLWAIAFGNGNTNSGLKNVLYFAAGPEDETKGAFGKIAVAP